MRKTKVLQPVFLFACGTRVRDKITSYTGIITARTEWINGCKRYVVQAQQLKDGKPVDVEGIDESQLELAPEQPGVPIVPKETGGPAPTPKREPNPTR